MGERIVHFIFIEHSQESLALSVAFYLSVLLLINASGLASAARRAVSARSRG